MSNIIPIFPIPIKVCKKYIFNKEELNLLLNKENINKNIGNNFSSNNKRILDNNILQNLKNFFIAEIENYAYQTLQIKQDIFFHITQSWTNFNEKNTYHHKHNHSNSIFSAVCFLDGPEKFKINFLNQYSIFSNLNLNYDSYNNYNSDSFWIECEKHSTIIFPSNLEHFVDKNVLDNTRVSLSFNTFLKGTIGDELSSNKITI
jgi:uncharacterized protein (TIGR02466 family)